MAAPVIYPGAVERTSFAERVEEKGYMLLDVTASDRPGGSLTRSSFQRLPVRPMVALELDPATHDHESLTRHLRCRLAALDPDAVVRITLREEPSPDALGALRAENLRSLAPPSMNINVSHRWKRGQAGRAVP
jgi:DNA repair exonuclease SbcCD nuclease subunit